MVSRATRHRTTYQDYLGVDEEGHVKHEFLAGEIYAMAGGTPEHAALQQAIIAALHSRLRGGRCHVFSSDLRVRVLETGLATCPDVTVVCGPLERDPESARTARGARVMSPNQRSSGLVKVLSAHRRALRKRYSSPRIRYSVLRSIPSTSAARVLLPPASLRTSAA